MRNALRSSLSAGPACVNGWLSMSNSYGAEVMARCGWDSLTVDMQHGVQDYASLVHCFQGASSAGIPLLARVASNESGMVGKVLDAGAWGVICPMINTPEEAARFVAACYYAPRGNRSNGPDRAAAYAEPDATYQSFANDEVLAIPMIETVEAVDAVEAILDVPGVSGVYVGPSDLALSMGLPPAFDNDAPEIIAIYRRIVKAATDRGLFAGIHCLSADYAARMADEGFRFVTVGSDAGLMAASARHAVGRFRSGVEAAV
ncbi:HpcH/HpaI aldolase family protein [Mesorhizobium sp. ASY16-5R]|uniref:HpcH/HpaI aldolase family protein n=1 Tax=Mesorhizobium sp. ASY16-5R TaxID=3445772 RepID=UPI003F9F957A